MTLSECEEKIQLGVEAFVTTGTALREIRDNRLYKSHECYPTFEDYCAKRWDFSRAHAYRLIGAAKVMENLSPIGDKQGLPACESVARPLAGLSPDKQREAWTLAVSRDPVPNAEETEAAAWEVDERADTRFALPPSDPLLDDLKTLWQRAGEETRRQFQAWTEMTEAVA